MNSKLYKLAKLVLNLAEIETDKAKLIIDGEAEVGKEVFIEDEAGELVVPADGEYEAEDKVIVIVEGKIAEIRDKEEVVLPAPEAEDSTEQPAEEAVEIQESLEEAPAEQPEPAAEPDEKDARIAELEAQIEELNQVIVEKDNEIGKLKAELEKSDAEPAEEELKMNKTEKSWSFKPRF